MKRSPMKPGTKPLERKTALKAKAPMARGSSRMRTSKPKSEKPKRIAHAGDERFLEVCRGQRCYLAIPGVCNHDPETVVPCHSNSASRGKGIGMKAPHRFTVPGCFVCHAAIDSGSKLGKEERRLIWEQAYARWEQDRLKLYPELLGEK